MEMTTALPSGIRVPDSIIATAWFVGGTVLGIAGVFGAVALGEVIAPLVGTPLSIYVLG